MNGYFQIQMDEKGVSLLLSPPIGDGEKIRVAELKEYLNITGVPYDVMAINSALANMGDEEVVLFLTPMKLPPVNEKCSVYVESDKMTAVLRMYPPSAGGLVMDKAHILEQIARMRVRAGIDEDAILMALEERPYLSLIHISEPTRR